ncbi:efflux RND transporter periplasmic adaptor subunit [Thioalkalicoccus limnaeus]|uniref:Efflux RND transporter periplasmic adaptor subunit n=1 Tax=Thioalkalicoccus limnaeus TaxID=120681 RepID=A0ABV4BLM7_9GAMM
MTSDSGWSARRAGWALVGLTISILLTGCGQREPAPSETLAEAMADSPLEHALKHLDPKYVCPMHPQIVRDDPGTCPICGMALVERFMDPQTGRHPEVTVAPAMQQTLGVRIGTVERGTLWRFIRTLGRVDYDETRLAHVHPRADGWIEALHVRAEGESVARGEDLADLYAPAILSAQIDFLLALEPQTRGGTQVAADQARNRLRVLDLPEEVIRDIERRREARHRVPVRAPLDGVITQLAARQGMYVEPATEMFTIADLSRVWVLVDIFEAQIDWLAPGQSAEIRVPARPGRVWEGRVDHLYPALDPTTRTLRARLVFDNPDLELKPNMFANVVIYGGPKRDVLMIPAEALIVTGERTTVVKALDEGRFQPVEVVPGLERGGQVEILSGLAEGDRIVLSGQFLIDSESNLQASFQRLSTDDDRGGSAGATGDHAGH